MCFQSTRPAFKCECKWKRIQTHTQHSHITHAYGWHPNFFFHSKRFIVTAFKLDYNMLICAYCVCGFCFAHPVFSLTCFVSFSPTHSMRQSVTAFKPRFEAREFISLRLMSNFTHSQSNKPHFFPPFARGNKIHFTPFQLTNLEMLAKFIEWPSIFKWMSRWIRSIHCGIRLSEKKPMSISINHFADSIQQMNRLRWTDEFWKYFVCIFIQSML